MNVIVISLSQNTVRRSIRRLAGSQSALFNSMVYAESEKEIEKGVMEIVRNDSVEMANMNGVEILLSDSEAKEYLEEVIREIKK